MWEIAIKISVGKLELHQFPSTSDIFPRLIENRIFVSEIIKEIIPLIETLPFIIGTRLIELLLPKQKRMTW